MPKMVKSDEVVKLDDADSLQGKILNLKFVKVLQWFLSLISLWPSWVFHSQVAWSETAFRLYVNIQVNTMLCGQLYYLVHNIGAIEFTMMAHVYITSFVTVAGGIRMGLANFKRYGRVVKTFLMEFHLYHFKKQTEYYHTIYAKVDKVSYLYSLMLMVMTVIGATLFNLSPAINNYRSGVFSKNRDPDAPLDFAVYYTLPFYDQFQHFYITTLHNYLISFIASVAISGFDGLLFVMVFQIIGHVLILTNNLRTLPRPKAEEMNNGEPAMYDEEENKIIHGLLKDIIIHHAQIVEFCDLISNFFGPVLAFNYFMHLVCGCMLLLVCFTTEPNILLKYGTLTIVMFWQLIQVSVIFEIVVYVSEKITDEVYCVPWESMGRGNRVAVGLLLQRTQTPIRLNAMGIVSVGVDTMVKILKTTSSTFLFLKSFK